MSVSFIGSGTINQHGHLEIGGIDTTALVKEFGTPLYVYDVSKIRQQARAFKQAFIDEKVEAKVAYASKAFSCIAMVQLADEEELYLDVVSGGELFTALTAGFPREKIHFHGNNKSMEELEMAVKEHVGCIVVDNFHELDCLQNICQKMNSKVSILLRITPGVDAHTHDYILTGQEDSKFGFDLESKQADQALSEALNSDYLDVLGVHCHIGSQIFETDGFIMAVRNVFKVLERWNDHFQYEPRVVNLGGGFGISYTNEDVPVSIQHMIHTLVSEVKKHVAVAGYNMPEVWIEPGRSLVGEAGTTLYKIGAEKRIPGVRNYISVDGGMNDNLRPALYQAKYEALLANRALDEKTHTASIAGKCCESGDMLIWDLTLPKTRTDDILAMFCTGAYGYSMANNYNRLPRPAVVFVEKGQAQLVVKRERYEDLIQYDRPLRKAIVTRV